VHSLAIFMGTLLDISEERAIRKLSQAVRRTATKDLATSKQYQ
jgi:hypothetical protein